MTIQPRDIDTVYKDLRDRLTGKTEKLTNFAETGFNYVWTRAFSRDIQEQEEKIVASMLSGWPDYAGKELDNEDLEKLGIDYDAEEINEYMKDEHLDQIGLLVGEERFQGQKATGEVTLQTSGDDVRIYEGTVVGTRPDNNGEFKRFKVDANSDGQVSGENYVTPDEGATQVTVDIIADEIGTEYNVGSSQITFLPNPPTGVLGVVNQRATVNGKEVQENEEFRRDVKRAVSRSSGGGTTSGVKEFIKEEVNGVRSGDVLLEEFLQRSPPSVDVIVDGGSEKDVKEAIRNSRPAGIKHSLIRPEVQNIGMEIRLSGDNIDTEFVKEKVESYLLEIGLSENFYRDELITRVMEADENIINVDNIEAEIPSVINKSLGYFSGAPIYRVASFYPEGGLGRTVEDKSGNVFQKGQDFKEIDVTGDGLPDGIEWIGDTPDDESAFIQNLKFYVDYYSREIFEFKSGKTSYITQASPTATTVIVDENGNEYDSSSYSFQDSDGTGVNDTLNWSDTSSLSNGDIFFVKYGKLQSVGEEIEEEHEYFNTSSVYTLDRELIPTESDNIIRDEDGVQYEQGVDFTFIDSDNDGQKDSVDWSENGETPSDGVRFYVSYKTPTDQIIGNRQKISPENIRVVTK